jgi:hypothetical protein
MEEIKLKEAPENHKAVDFNAVDEMPEKFRNELAKEVADTEKRNAQYNSHDETYGYFMIDLALKPDAENLVFGINQKHKLFVKKFEDLKSGDYVDAVVIGRQICTVCK